MALGAYNLLFSPLWVGHLAAHILLDPKRSVVSVYKFVYSVVLSEPGLHMGMLVVESIMRFSRFVHHQLQCPP